ncbi:hypothetical protein IJG28_02695 [Candidatus Saccharibacteria bacterium]|nr:hypothetical protein [Candidatus Saccharibacteria bacterium]
MNVYISGISGTGMGPLALMAKQAGFSVAGSDLAKGAIYDELLQAGIEVEIGQQDGKFLAKKIEDGINWFVYTSALTEDHAELVMAKEAGIKCTKRDDFTAYLVDKLGLKMVAVAGTHGKTTTTAMIIWTALRLGLPVSYIVGTTLGFAVSGAYHAGDKYFIYEADEYDRNFLKYHPWLAVLPAVTYDHSDIYPTREDYVAAFLQFEKQSENVVREGIEADYRLAGDVRRKDASLAAAAIAKIMVDMGRTFGIDEITKILSEFPGVGRRFERLSDGVYTDYAHHPEEIEATIEVANEQAEMDHKKGVVVVYQPHQNIRQHEVKAGYHDVFKGASKIYWLPTYLTREDPKLAVITPEEFVADLDNAEDAEPAKLDESLATKLREHVKNGDLVILLTAGPADEWFRNVFRK